MSRRRGEAGYSLVFALVVMTAFSLLAAALISFSATLSLAQGVHAEIARGRNAADAAIDHAIQRIMEEGAAAQFGTTTDLLVPGTLVNDIGSINVTNVSLTSLTISPSSTTTSANVGVTFTATAVSGGTTITFAPQWAVSCTGATATITQAGRFLATSGTGTCTVSIVVNNVSATAAVTVN